MRWPWQRSPALSTPASAANLDAKTLPVPVRCLHSTIATQVAFVWNEQACKTDLVIRETCTECGDVVRDEALPPNPYRNMAELKAHLAP